MCDRGILTKENLRRELLSARRGVDPLLRQVLDRRIAGHLLDSPLYQKSETVFCYFGTGWEIGTGAILEDILRSGRRLALPLCLPGGVMEAREVRSLQGLVPGAFGIPEPAQRAPLMEPAAISLAVVPALAYDREGYRIGRGGGYYDRYLKETTCPRAGLCYTLFIREKLPRQGHDVPVDILFTEEGAYT